MSGPRRHFSILNLMGGVLIMAAECGLLRFVLETTLAEALMVLPLLNFMLLGLVLSRRDPRSQPFWDGFEGAGLAVLILLCFMAFYTPATLAYPLQWLGDHRWLSDESPGGLAISIGLIAATYGGPQLLVASAGGWLWGRYRVVIERRPSESGASHARTAGQALPYGDSLRPSVIGPEGTPG